MAQQKLSQLLKDTGSKLENPPNSKDALIKLLKQAASCLSEMDQSPSPPMLESLKPCLEAIAKPELLKHQDKDVKLLVATCICEITRITAPEAPYSDDVLRDIFHLIVSTFHGLGDINGPSFGRRVVILETLARYRSCVVMLDLECDDLVNEMFNTFFSVVSDEHSESVLKSMQTIMVLVVDESEDVQENLLLTLFSVLGRGKSDVSMAARRLAMNVIEHCAGKLEPCIRQFLISSMSGDNESLTSRLDYNEVIYDIYQCAPQILGGIIPYITGELLTDRLDVRLKAVKLLGDLFALPGHAISEAFRPLFSEFLKRLTDRVVEVRISVIEHVKNCLLSNPFRDEAPEIISALSDRLLDYDENVRKQVVAAVYDVACHTLKSIPVETAKLVAERLRDKSLLVKRYTMERLANLDKHYCLKFSDGSISPDELEWIPGKILRCLYDKDFRSETIEVVLCGSLSPTEFSIRDKVKHWVTVFSGFEKVDVKALEQVLVQKQRLQQEMLKYLSLRQTCQDGDAPELQKKTFVCLRTMSRLFSDPAKAEEGFQILNQLKDANIWKILTSLLDPNTGFHQAWTCRDDLLKILGEKHPLYDFLGTLSVKCSYLLFNKEFVKETLLEADAQKSARNTKLIWSCMNLLVILASFCPSLLAGAEEDLVNLLKEDNEIIKEGIAHVLARAGGVIREQLAMTSSSVDLLLETLCLEGSRKQAKYSVQALAAITKDDGLKALSVLYKRLVDMLEKRTHLPAILQSLGCIAQSAMPVFETREDEIVGFITCKLLECSNKSEDNTKIRWDERSELCLLKIYGIKALVKSYLPVKDAHLRRGIENLLGILRNILSFGEISKDIESSAVDKAHLRLASAKAVLRLSRHWDHKIPVDVFHLTVQTSQDRYSQVKKLFISKVHQYIKERLLDVKYACAFLFNIIGSNPSEFKENKHNLVEVVQMCHRDEAKARQSATQCDVNSPVAHPEYILTYLVHALAHHSSCPNIDDCMDVQAFEPIYRQLHLLLSVLVHGGEDRKTEVNSVREKAHVSAIISVFQSIKCSEDVVDVTKSKNSHAICDLGLSITKRLAHNREDFTESALSFEIPTILYRPLDKNKDEDILASGDQTWLAGDSIIAHFESRKIDDMELATDEKAIKDSDKDGNEVPLGKMMKTLKSQRTNKKKVAKKHSLPADRKILENDVDILGVVREINLDSIDRAKTLEPAKLTDDHEYFVSQENTADKNFTKKVPVSRKRRKRKTSNEESMPVPKRKRSAFAQVTWSNSRNSAEGRRKASGARFHDSEISSWQSVGMDVEPPSHSEEQSTDRDLTEPTESDLLVSCLPTIKSISSSHKEKDSGHNLNDMTHMVGEAFNHDPKKVIMLETDKNYSTGNSKTSMGLIRKRKRRSISGLAKCSSKRAEKPMELIGCRIKVWWPIDKKFYEGMVQSYDAGKRKHVILYEDGDMEVLQLDKERWEVINNDYKPKKRQKSPNVSLSKGMMLKLKREKRAQGVQRRNKKSSIKSSSPKDRRKSASKISLKHDQSGILDDTDSGEALSNDTSDLSNPRPHADSEVDDINSDNSEMQHASLSEAEENIVDEPTGPKESDTQEKSDSSHSGGDRDSDDEPLSVWKQRAVKAA